MKYILALILLALVGCAPKTEACAAYATEAHDCCQMHTEK